MLWLKALGIAIIFIILLIGVIVILILRAEEKLFTKANKHIKTKRLEDFINQT